MLRLPETVLGFKGSVTSPGYPAQVVRGAPEKRAAGPQTSRLDSGEDAGCKNAADCGKHKDDCQSVEMSVKSCLLSIELGLDARKRGPHFGVLGSQVGLRPRALWSDDIAESSVEVVVGGTQPLWDTRRRFLNFAFT